MRNKFLKIITLIAVLITAALLALPASAENFKTGDMNGDGFVNSDDAIYLLRYTLTSEKYPLACNHDIIKHEGKAPTAKEGGWKEYETCSRCNYTTYEALPPDTNAPEDEFDTPEDIGGNDEKKYIFNYTFDNVTSMHDETPEGFDLTCHNNLPYELVAEKDGYITNSTDDGYIFIEDKNFLLNGKSFVFEAEILFNSLHVQRESNIGKGSYPISALSWLRKTPS